MLDSEGAEVVPAETQHTERVEGTSWLGGETARQLTQVFQSTGGMCESGA